MTRGNETTWRDFFISHAGTDQQWAEWIGQQLITAGYVIELDVWEWAPGTDFVDAMQTALNRADRVLAVYTQAYFTRPYAQAEHRGAFTSTGTGRPGRVIPVRVEPCEVPELYASLIRIELVGLDEIQAVERLLAGVAGPAGPPAGQVGFPGRRPAGTERAGMGVVWMGPTEFPHALPPIWSVPPRNPFFTGRVNLLEEIHRRLGAPAVDGAAVGVVPVQGMGGIGKTQIAVEYAHRYANYYQLIWWVNADSPTLTMTGLLDLAGALALPIDGPPATVIRRLWAALAQREDWLLIYDNVDDPATVADLRPPASGRLLVTSRSPTIGRLASELITVVEFDRAESVSLLRRRRPVLSAEEADRLAAALGDLPLAVEQAGCFLADTGLDVDDYLDLLATQPAAAGLADPTLDRHPGLAAIVATSMGRMKELNPSAAALLEQMAFLAPEPLPLIPSGASRTSGFGVSIGDAATTATIVRQLTGLALVRRTGAALQVHRLVQALIRSALTAEERTATRRAAQNLLATAHPGDPDNAATWSSYAAITPHVQAFTDPSLPGDDAEPEVTGFRALLLDVVYYLYTSGHYRPAIALASHTLQRWRQTLPPDHLDTLKLATNLASALIGSGDFAAAVELSEDTLARARRVLSDDHPHTLHTANGLAGALNLMGEAAQARDLHYDTLSRRRRVLGEDHPQTLNSANNLAVVLNGMGDHAAARELVEDALPRARRVLGDDHPHTLRAADHLAAALIGLGEYAPGRELAADTLPRAQRVLGDDHADTLRAASHLALVIGRSGDLPSALVLARDTVNRCRRVLGEGHLRTRWAEDILATLESEDTGAADG